MYRVIIDAIEAVYAVDSGLKSSILLCYILADPVQRFFLVDCCCILELFYAGLAGQRLDCIMLGSLGSRSSVFCIFR